LIERWFPKLTEKQIRRGIFHGVPELAQTIKNYISVNDGSYSLGLDCFG